MHPALWVSKTGLEAQQIDISVISNNLANVSTTGFKKGRAVFEDLFYQNYTQPGAPTSESTQSPTGFLLGTGVNPVATQKIFEQGNVLRTDNPMDLAINGRGFFQVLKPDGTLAYTRDGQFQVDANGQMVTSKGYLVQPAITFPAETQSISIGSDGTVSINSINQTTPTQIGQLQLADFINPAGLAASGENLYSETAASGTPTIAVPGQTGLGNLLQGSIETSNVNVVEELVHLIETQRAYEMNAKAIETVDNMLQYVNQTI